MAEKTSYNATLSDLRELLIEGLVSTQDDICQALEQRGHAVNQSKVSRMLHKVGAVKAKNESGEVVYRLPREPAPPSPSSSLLHLTTNIAANETTIVVNTSPGSAQLIARLLDYHKDKVDILGTIAGDDTIFVMPRSTSNIEETVKAIKTLLLSDG